MPQWETVFSAKDRWEAELLVGLLKSAGFLVRLKGEALGELYGLHTGPLAQVEIAVPAHQVQEAKKFIHSQLLEKNTEENL